MSLCLNLKLLKHQADFFDLFKRKTPVPFPLLVGGVGCGKTFTIVAAAIDMLISYKGLPGAIYEPTFPAIRDIIIPELDSFCDAYGIMHYLNKQTYEYHTSLGTIKLRSMHDPNKIIGVQVAWAFVDEIDTMPIDKARKAWERIVARARIPLPDGRPNIVGAATTPEGFSFAYERWVEKKSIGYSSVTGKTKTALEAGFISKTYMANLIESFTEELQKAYLEGEFVNLSSSSFYYGFTQDNIKKTSIDRGLPLNLCFDFNVNPGVACIAQDRNITDIRMIEEIYLEKHSNTKEVCTQIKIILNEYTNMDVVIYGDASGRSRDTRSNMSDFAIIEEELQPFFKSFTFSVPSKNPSIKDRDNAVNKVLQTNAVSIDEKNKYLIRDFRQIIRKGNDMDKSNIKLTHISDAFGYYISNKFPVMFKSLHKKPRAL